MKIGIQTFLKLSKLTWHAQSIQKVYAVETLIKSISDIAVFIQQNSLKVPILHNVQFQKPRSRYFLEKQKPLSQGPSITIMAIQFVKFSNRGTIFLPKNHHTQRKLLNFENWVNRKGSKSAKIRLSKSIFYVKNYSNLSYFFCCC